MERRAEEIGVVVGVFVGGAGRNGAVGSQLKQRVVFSGDFDEGKVGVGLHFSLSVSVIQCNFQRDRMGNVGVSSL